MNDCTMPVTISLHRPLWQRWLEVAQHWIAARRAAHLARESSLDLQAAMALNDRTLRDIGAPEWLQEQAAAQRQVDTLALRAARADLGGGGVRWLG